MNITYKECPYCGIMTPVYYGSVHKCHGDPRIIYTQRCLWCEDKFIVNGFASNEIDIRIKRPGW